MRVLGLDGGIASIGWAVVEIDEDSGNGCIVDAGTWMFDSPEEPAKNKAGAKLKSEARRTFRCQRRVIRRRRQRMNEVRRILAQYGLLQSADRDALKQPGLDPWKLRAEGLDRVLSPVELAVALGHIARHRGFKSNAKGGAKLTDAPDEKSKMKEALASTQEKLARYQTPAQMLTEDENFVVPGTVVRRFRNRDGDYSRSLLRADLADEARKLFRAQRRLQSGCATEELDNEFMDETQENTAFFQRPLQDSVDMVGPCPFERDEKRSPRHGYSFERFRFLSRLNNLRLREGREERGLTVDEIRSAAADFGAAATFSFGALRKKLKLPDTAMFVGVKAEDEKKDVVGRTDKGKAAAGTYKLRRAIIDNLGEMAWGVLADVPERLDKIAEIISFRDDLDSICKGLTEADFEEALVAVLVQAASDGALDAFTGAGHISAKAARNIIPGLLQGLTYDKACAQAGYDHTASRERHAFDVGVSGKEALARILSQERISRELVGSPTARKALIEAVKQVKAIVEKHGVPDFIHVELARDVGKSIEERGEIERGIEKRNKEKEKLKELFKDKIGREPRGAEDLLRFELWLEQSCLCLYSGVYISPKQIADDENSVQVDHILPWSRFGDDSYRNKTLCLAKANQDKKGRTPFEWFSADKTEAEWDAFVVRVEALPSRMGFKKRNCKLKDAEAAAKKFRTRNLNDTRWTCRLLAEALKQMYPPNERNEKDEDRGVRRVFTRPGALTDKLRRAWGLQGLKKINGERIPDDRHHALDAIVVAATTEPTLQRVTKQIQKLEALGSPYDLKNIPEPWNGFRRDTEQAVEKVFVARAERRRARGKAHDATVKQVREIEGERIVFERKFIEKLSEKDLEKIPVPEPHDKVVDPKKLRDEMVESLRAWIGAGKPKESDKLPRSPKGDIIRKVRVATNAKAAVRIGEATVDRGEMARVDVFRKANAKGIFQYFLVPVYPHEIATLDGPPMRAVQGGGDEEKWPQIDSSFEFLWSINQMTLLEITKTDGEVIRSYFRSLDRNTGALTVSDISNSTATRKGIGTRTLLVFKKLQVDRLGRISEVQRELRTWRGKVCT